jgi:hypothetical protein
VIFETGNFATECCHFSFEVESVKNFAKENAWPQFFASTMTVGQSEQVPTSTPCRMDDVGTENTFHCIPVW